MSLFRKLFLLPQLCVLLLVFLAGCVTSSPGEKWKPVARHDGNKVHVVKWTDENLSAVASWYTGSSDNVETIANANPTLNPDRIHAGDQVFIPQNLLKTRSEMSRGFLNTFLSSPVTTIKTSSGSASIKVPRVIAPTPYKERKGVRNKGSYSVSEKPVPQIIPQPLPEPEPESSQKNKQGLHLFGPK